MVYKWYLHVIFCDERKEFPGIVSDCLLKLHICNNLR